MNKIHRGEIASVAISRRNDPGTRNEVIERAVRLLEPH
ncbi:hypothetical protein NB311A_09286 [Nitrobacter sp. Nb-311A]|nr:hypothetical protein NB311A_09286 [Nitrobacter sp. Nb-311A]